MLDNISEGGEILLIRFGYGNMVSEGVDASKGTYKVCEQS